MDNQTDNYTCKAQEMFKEELWSSNMIIFFILEIIISILAIIGNSLVFIVFLREKKIRRKINYYIISLAIADFCVATIGIPLGLLPVRPYILKDHF